MVENVRRQLILIGTVLAISIALFFLPNKPLKLGLDLAGGTRLVYSIDVQDAIDSGKLTAGQDPIQVLEDTIAIIRSRIDSSGLTEPQLRRVGTDRIEILLPGTDDTTNLNIVGTLAAAVSDAQDLQTQDIVLNASDEELLRRFPGGGGVISIGDEHIRYTSRVGEVLRGITRKWDQTLIASHASGESVRLVSDDAIKNAIENLGDLRFMIVADDVDFTDMGTDRASAERAVQDWHNAPENQGEPVATYNSLTPEQGGPPAGLQWWPDQLPDGVEESDPFTRLVPLLVPDSKWSFTGEDLDNVFPTQDGYGLPAVGFDMKDQVAGAFGDFTGENIDRSMAILLNDEIVTRPNIESRLPGGGQIRGRFTQMQVDSLVTVLRSGSLTIKPELQSEARVGATLGTEYTRRGFISGIVALIGVAIFMMVYYRRLGIFAAIGLTANIVMLVGVMIALQATLTLPGLAGIVLTIGMAVDANILIFDRIREEQETGRKPIQAAKNGFQQALSAIIDSNVTTFLSALILMNVGTGPVRGFAVTLAVGVLTSMFSALVIVRTLIHMDLERQEKPEAYKMTRWLADADFKIIQKARVVFPVSLALIVIGLVTFFSVPNSQKLGIDFLGGARVMVRTEEAMTPDALRAAVAKIPGAIGGSDVAALPTSEEEAGKYSLWTITYKRPKDAAEETAGIEQTLRGQVADGLESELQKGPLTVSVTDGDTQGRVELALYFERPHSIEDVTAQLTAANISEASVQLRAGRQSVYDAQGLVALGANAGTIENNVRAVLGPNQFDSAGQPFRLADPIPETAVIGGQVVGELKNSAIIAIALSLLATVLYIRVRFAEYTYGFAAVAAILHDVLFTLGAVAALVAFPLIQVEINLPLIAAFLTIVGYSINDTIVTFDRVRENRPRMKGDLSEIVNKSINQVMSRTIITSGTSIATILVVLLFNFGTGSVLEGFAFSLLFGMLIGTYSSIFIAAPVFLLLEKRALEREKASSESSGKGSAKPKPDPA